MGPQQTEDGEDRANQWIPPSSTTTQVGMDFSEGGGSSQQVETTQIDDHEEGRELFEGTVETGVTGYYLEDDESEAEGLTTDSEQSGEIDHPTRCR